MSKFNKNEIVFPTSFTDADTALPFKAKSKQDGKTTCLQPCYLGQLLTK